MFKCLSVPRSTASPSFAPLSFPPALLAWLQAPSTAPTSSRFQKSGGRYAPTGCEVKIDTAIIAGTSRAYGQGKTLVPPALDRGWNVQRIPVFGDRPPRHLDALAVQDVDDPVVGQNVIGRFVVDQRLDAVTHGFRRVHL